MKRLLLLIIVTSSVILAQFAEFDLEAYWMPEIPEGPANGSSFGRSMSIVGDLNGDGVSDLALASELACDTVTGEIPGKVYIYFGQFGFLDISDTPDLIIKGENHDDWFGYSVSGGDFNADGYNDVAVLAEKGEKLYVYYGSPAMDTTADLTLEGGTSEYFRYKFLFVGDINGDSYDDLAVPRTLSGDSYIFLFYGGPGADLVADDTLFEVGYKLGPGGDINGDGIDDLLIGDPYAAEDSGRVYVFMGGDPFETIPVDTLQGETSDSDFGWNCAILGDLNADGFDDIGSIVSGPSSWIWKQCWIYWGSDTNYYEFAGMVEDSIRQLYGTAVIGAGDINYDGYDDFIVGAPGANIVDHEPGHVHIYYGGEAAPESTDIFLVGETGNDQYGLCLAAGDDLNYDGYDDLAIGAFKSDMGGYFSGKVYIHSGKMLSEGVSAPQEEITGQPARGWGGYILASGDINDDGYNDIAFTHEYRNRSEVYLCLGDPTGMDMEPDYILGDGRVDTEFGSGLDFGDFDGDGIDDLAIGIPDWDVDTIESTSSDEGEVRIYFGGSSFDTIPGFAMHGTSENKIFGYSLSFVGDINGDGTEELLVGAPEYIYSGYADSTGYAYLYFGADDTLPEAIYKGDSVKCAFGAAVIGTGDMTGDGIPDYAISAHRIHWPSSGYGKVYVYEGNPTPVDSPLVVYTDDLYKWIGKNMAAPGDVDGDGYDDLLVNCRSTEWGGYGEGNGAARLYFGDSTLSPTAYFELTAPGTAAGGYGVGIGECGDINLDGYPDFAVGAPNGIPGEWMTAGAIAIAGHTGGDRAYIYYGGTDVFFYPDLELIPPRGHEMFGYDICSAGMTSFDGSYDIAIGAPGNSLAGYETGKVYVLSSIHSGVAEEVIKPEQLAIATYPNPFNGSVRMEFTPSGEYEFEIFDINGRIVQRKEGINQRKVKITWNARDLFGRELPSGVYFARITCNGITAESKLLYLK